MKVKVGPRPGAAKPAVNQVGGNYAMVDLKCLSLIFTMYNKCLKNRSLNLIHVTNLKCLKHLSLSLIYAMSEESESTSDLQNAVMNSKSAFELQL